MINIEDGGILSAMANRRNSRHYGGIFSFLIGFIGLAMFS